MASHSVEVRLLGQKIALKAQGGADPELVSEVAELVSSRLKDAEGRGKSPAPHHVAVLALFTLAEEYLMAKRRVSDHQQKLSEKARELIEWAEAEAQ